MAVSFIKIYLFGFCTYFRIMQVSVFLYVLSERLVHDADTTVADELARKVRILCAVVKTDSSARRLEAIRETWGPRCNEIMYLDKGHKTWKMVDDQKHCATIYKEHAQSNNFECYIIPENMRYMLMDYDPDSNIYFMSKLNKGLNLILGRRALQTYVLANIHKICNERTTEYQDRKKCFSAIGLTAADSRDSWGRDRILPTNPYDRYYLDGLMEFWNCSRKRYSRHPEHRVLLDNETYDCFSSFAVSFEYATTDRIYVIDFLIYQLRPYGINYHDVLPKVPRKITLPHDSKQKYNLPKRQYDHHRRRKDETTMKIPPCDEYGVDIDEGSGNI